MTSEVESFHLVINHLYFFCLLPVIYFVNLSIVFFLIALYCMVSPISELSYQFKGMYFISASLPYY